MADRSAAFAAEVHPKLRSGEIQDGFVAVQPEIPQSELVGTLLLLHYAAERWPDLTVAELCRSMHLMGEIGEQDAAERDA